MRFFSPLSGIGHRNFPVAPMAHWSPTRAMIRASGSSGGANIRRAASPSASWKTWPTRSAVSQQHPVGNGDVVPPEPERVDEHQAVDASRARGRHLAGDHAAEGVAHEDGPGEPERIQQLVVAEDQIPHARRGGRRRRVVPGLVPGCSGAWTVKLRASSSRKGSQVRPQGPWKKTTAGPAGPWTERACGPGPARRERSGPSAPSDAPLGPWAPTWRRGAPGATSGSPIPRRPRCRADAGRTSVARRVMFFRVSSWGMDPMCTSSIRFPTRSPFTTSSSRRWRTVAGLPAMT